MLYRLKMMVEWIEILKYLSYIFAPQKTPSKIQPHLINEHLMTEILNDLSNFKQSSTSKDVQQQIEKPYDRRVVERTDLPLYVFVRFQQRESSSNQL